MKKKILLMLFVIIMIVSIAYLFSYMKESSTMKIEYSLTNELKQEKKPVDNSVSDNTQIEDDYIDYGDDTTDAIKYEIVSDIPELAINKSVRGYQVIEKDGYFYIVISMGERSTGGYSIEATKIDVNNNDIHIYVKETFPELAGMVTQAFTYPCEIIKLNMKPNNIVIESQNNGTKFQKID